MTTMSTEQIFMVATQRVGDGDVQLTDSQRMTFYGLQKQALDGDCNVPQPPKGNITARSKYDAWITYNGLSKEVAMKKYISNLEKVDPQFKPGAPIKSPQVNASIPRVDSFVLSSTNVLKEGLLFKQKDVFKGWRPRYFVLDENFLCYYLQKGDMAPKKYLQMFGASITPVRPTKVGEVEYYPLVISHPKTTKVYNLAASTKGEAETWIKALTSIAGRDAPSPIQLNCIDRLLERRPTPEDEGNPIGQEPVNKVLTLTNIPEKYTSKVDCAITTMLKTITDDEGWVTLDNKNGINASRKTGTGSVCVRADVLLPFSGAEIFSMILSEDNKKKFNSTLSFSKVIKTYSPHTTIEHVRLKQVWPTPSRDFCNLAHWRLLNDGSVVTCSTSEKFETFCPIEEGVIRAELILSGFVIKPHVSGGSQCFIVTQYDLRGSLSTSIVSMLTSSIPLVLASLQACMTEYGRTAPKPLLLKKKGVTYEELLFVAENNKVNHSAAAAVFELAKEVNTATAAKAQDEAPKANNMKSVIKSALVEATDLDHRRKQLRSLDTAALSVLFMPVAMYYAVSSEFRGVAFILGLLFSLDYVMRLHLGIPFRKVDTLQHASIPDGRMLIRFQVDLAKFLRYLEICRLETSTEITVTHIAAKAVAIALSDIPSLNGHVIGGDFYQSRSSGIDIGISFELTESETVVLKLENVEAKPIDYIASEVQNRTQELREDKSPSNTRKARLLGLLPGGMSIYVRQIFNALGGKYGISIPLLGIVGFPHGVAMVVTLPSKEASDHEIDLAMISNMTDSSTPIVVTIGGVRLVPTLDQDRKMGSSHVLNVAVSIDNNAGSLAEGKRFASKLQQLMNTPALLDKADRRAAVSKQDEKLAEEKAAARLSALKKK